jgi:hypothetical protein
VNRNSKRARTRTSSSSTQSSTESSVSASNTEQNTNANNNVASAVLAHSFVSSSVEEISSQAPLHESDAMDTSPSPVPISSIHMSGADGSSQRDASPASPASTHSTSSSSYYISYNAVISTFNGIGIDPGTRRDVTDGCNTYSSLIGIIIGAIKVGTSDNLSRRQSIESRFKKRDERKLSQSIKVNKRAQSYLDSNIASGNNDIVEFDRLIEQCNESKQQSIDTCVDLIRNNIKM